MQLYILAQKAEELKEKHDFFIQGDENYLIYYILYSKSNFDKLYKITVDSKLHNLKKETLEALKEYSLLKGSIKENMGTLLKRDKKNIPIEMREEGNWIEAKVEGLSKHLLKIVPDLSELFDLIKYQCQPLNINEKKYHQKLYQNKRFNICFE